VSLNGRVESTATSLAVSRDLWRASSARSIIAARRRRRKAAAAGMGDARSGEPGVGQPGIRTFLIADVRGYTLFTQERGDEAAAKLAARFAGIAREVVEDHGGSVIELRGDEALAVFGSARQAIRAATHAQDRFLEETVADPYLGLPVGIGLDAGEAVPVETGYRGGALNLAARLCGRAGPGEILASQAAVHLAQKVDGVRYIDKGALHLKGLADPIRVFRVISEEGDPAERFRQLAPGRPARGPAPIRLARRHPVIAVVAALALVAAIVVPSTLALRGGGAGGRIVGDALAMIDLGTGKLEETVPLESRPGAVAVGLGWIWVTRPDRGVVDQINPETKAIRNTISVGADPSDIAIGDGSVWVSNGGSSTVSRISLGLDRNPVDIVHIPVPGGPTGIAVGKGGVWVASSLEASVSRIDPESNDVGLPIGVGDRPADIAVDDLGVWVANAGPGTVSRIDPDTNDVRLVQGVGNGPRAIVAGPDGVWVANFLDGTVAHIDPETNLSDMKIPVGGAPTGLTLAGGSVWVSQGSSGSVARIEPGSGAATLIQLGSEVNDIALGDSVLWVTVRGAASAHRGGTLTVWAPAVWFDSKDPALAYSSETWAFLPLLNDGLVGFPHTGGLEGTTPVPDLARSLPEPTAGGRSYTFQLRQGVMYSTGEPVRPEDFRRAIERVFANLDPRGNPSGGVPYFSGIVGADECVPGDPCDLSRGIVADDEAGTVTFKLSAPDPDFLYALALPFAYAVPAETPDALGNDSFIPATGPYVVETYVEGKEIVLARNPRFDSWDAAARPDGFPDRIVWRLGSDPDRMVADTLNGEADFMFPVPPDQIPELEIQHPGQLHRSPRANTSYMSLNTEVQPCDDVDVRRALNFAVDRKKTATLSGHQWLSVGATCQIIPPTLPGYSRYCPYTLHPDQGTWTAPDFATARRLVNRSGTAGQKVTVWASEEPWPISVPVGRYFVKLLTKLHYRATLKIVDAKALFSALYGRAQISFEMWTSDYAAESGYIPPVLGCNADYNDGGFCDPFIDDRMEEATGLQSTDVARALDLWSKVDHDLVDQAPWVPLGNADWVDLASRRLGNYQSNPLSGPIVDQMWVR
jgi:ABC-type transport system substrate-binding protein/class 3 adenylate cyclase